MGFLPFIHQWLNVLLGLFLVFGAQTFGADAVSEFGGLGRQRYGQGLLGLNGGEVLLVVGIERRVGANKLLELWMGQFVFHGGPMQGVKLHVG